MLTQMLEGRTETWELRHQWWNYGSESTSFLKHRWSCAHSQTLDTRQHKTEIPQRKERNKMGSRTVQTMEEEFQLSDSEGRNPSNPAMPLNQLYKLGMRDQQGGYTCSVEQWRRESWRDFHGFSLLSLLKGQEICREEGF